jgi:hypothetical protein
MLRAVPTTDWFWRSDDVVLLWGVGRCQLATKSQLGAVLFARNSPPQSMQSARTFLPDYRSAAAWMRLMASGAASLAGRPSCSIQAIPPG